MTDTLTQLRNLRMLESYLSDLVCETKDPEQVDTLSAALATVQRALAELEQTATSISGPLRGR
jgi:hypothetical protein